MDSNQILQEFPGGEDVPDSDVNNHEQRHNRNRERQILAAKVGDDNI